MNASRIYRHGSPLRRVAAPQFTRLRRSVNLEYSDRVIQALYAHLLAACIHLMASENPYSPGSVTEDALDSPQDKTHSVVVSELGEDSRGNLKLTATSVRIAAVFAFLASIGCVLQIWAMTKFYGWSESWNIGSSTIIVRAIAAPCWLILSFMLWQYSKSLIQMAKEGIRHSEYTIESQTKVWLAVGLILFVFLLSIIFASGSSLAQAVRQAG